MCVNAALENIRCIEYKNNAYKSRCVQTLPAHCWHIVKGRHRMMYNKMYAKMQATLSQLLVPDGLANPRVCDLLSTW